MYGCMGHILVLMVLLQDLQGVCEINIELSTILKMVKVGTISYSTFNWSWNMVVAVGQFFFVWFVFCSWIAYYYIYGQWSNYVHVHTINFCMIAPRSLNNQPTMPDCILKSCKGNVSRKHSNSHNSLDFLIWSMWF